jgi:hypothetical protein
VKLMFDVKNGKRPVGVDTIRTFLVWQCLTKMAATQDRAGLIYALLTAMGADAEDAPEDKYDAPYWAVAKLLENADDTMMRALIQFILLIMKWAPIEDDFYTLCCVDADELVSRAA